MLIILQLIYSMAISMKCQRDWHILNVYYINFFMYEFIYSCIHLFILFLGCPGKRTWRGMFLNVTKSFVHYLLFVNHLHILQQTWQILFCLRKIEIVQFASRTRQLFVRLLALVKWASNAGKVEKCAVCQTLQSWYEGYANFDMSVGCWLTLSSHKSLTDDFQLLGSTDNLVCGHSWQACLSSQRCPRPCSSAQLCHSICDRCSHNRIISSLAHMYTSKYLIADLQ